MKLLIDMDGVMVEHSAMFMRWLNKQNGTSHRYEDISAFRYPNLTHRERRQVMKWWHKADLYDSHPPEPGCISALAALRRRHRVVAVTSPMDGHVHSKWRWLRRTGGFREADIVITGDKTLVPGDVLLDDRVKNLEQAEETGHALPVCFDRPWNQDWAGARVRSWPEFVDHVAGVQSAVEFDEMVRRNARLSVDDAIAALKAEVGR